MELVTNLKEKFKTLSKKQVAICAGCAFVVVAGGIYGVVSLASDSGDARSTAGVTMVGASAYMEETVSLGDIVVGISETGTASMYQEEISFGFVTEVIEFYVKAGEDVVEGQALALLDMDTVNEEKDALALEIADAEAALAEAEADYDVQAIQAAKTLSETLYNGEMADYDYAVALTEIDERLAELAENITDLEDEWVTAVSELYNTLEDDYDLDDLSDAKSSAKSTLTSATTTMNNAWTDVEGMKFSFDQYGVSVTDSEYDETLLTNLKSLSTSGFSSLMSDFSEGGKYYNALCTVTTTDPESGTATTSAATSIQDISDTYSSLFKLSYGFAWDSDYATSLLALAASSNDQATIEIYYAALSTYNSASSAYTSASNAYSTAYSNYESAYEKAEDEVASLDEQIADARESYTEYENSITLLKIAAEADYETTLVNYAAAYDVYDNTMAMNSNLVETAEQTLELLETEYESYDDLPADGIVLATCSGYVMRLADTDTSYNADVALVTIGSDQSVEIWVSISQDDIADIAIGMETNVVFDAYEEYSIPAVVESISTSSSSGMTSTVNYTMEIICDLSDYPDIVVFDSMSATITFVQRQESGVIMVSSKCVTTEDGISYVKMLDDNGDVIMVEVETGFSDGFDVEITSGLEVGDVVIIESAVG